LTCDPVLRVRSFLALWCHRRSRTLEPCTIITSIIPLRTLAPSLGKFIMTIGVISPSSPPDAMPGHHIAKQPLQYASARFQHNLLFGPIAPHSQSALLPQPGSIEGRRDRISCGLLEPFLPSVFSGRRSSQSIFARIESHECAVCPGSAQARLKQCSRGPLKSLIVVFGVILHPPRSDGWEK
jgi:hypothetical protein